MAVNKARATVTTSAGNITFTGNGRVIRATNLDGAGVVYFNNSGNTATAADENEALGAGAGAQCSFNAPAKIGGVITISAIASASTLVHLRLE